MRVILTELLLLLAWLYSSKIKVKVFKPCVSFVPF